MEHVRPTATLTLTGARAALDAAVAHAAEHELRMNVAVTDAGGTLLAFARMDDAFAHSGGIAVDKARTTAGFGGIATQDLYGALSGEDAVIRGIGNRPGIAVFGGGVPIIVGEEIVGAIGASGGSVTEDTQVAEAGAAVIASG